MQTSTCLPLSKTKTVLHIGIPKADSLLTHKYAWEKLACVDSFLDDNHTLIFNGYWLKKRTQNGRTFYSLKIQSEKPNENEDLDEDSSQVQEMELTEITDLEEIEKRLEQFNLSISQCTEFAKIPFTRWRTTLQQENVLQIDSCKFDETNYYLICSLQGNTKEDVQKVLKNVISPISKFVEPVPSKIINWLNRFDEKVFEKLYKQYKSIRTTHKYFEDRILWYHRWSDPFKTISLLQSENEAKQWLQDNNIHSVDLVTLYNANPQQLQKLLPPNICPIVYHKLHDWEAPFTHEFEELEEITTGWKNGANVDSQVRSLKEKELDFILCTHLVEGTIRETVAQQLNLLLSW